MDKIILHFDMNNYFTSVELLDRRDIIDLPVCVSGDMKLRHGIVLSKNEIAKKRGIITGMSLKSALLKCPDLIIINPNYSKYLYYTRLSRKIYYSYADKVYPYGLDEAFLDITNTVGNFDEGKKLALKIKKEIKQKLNLEVSVGISFNYVFAKLASDKKAKDIFCIDKENYINITKNIPCFELLFVGSKMRKKLKDNNILTIDDLRNTDIEIVKSKFGKNGETIRSFAYGEDDVFYNNLINDKIKSLSNTITPPKNISYKKDCFLFIYLLSCFLSKRLTSHKLEAKGVSLKIKFFDFTSKSVQKKFLIIFKKKKTFIQYQNN